MHECITHMHEHTSGFSDFFLRMTSMDTPAMERTADLPAPRRFLRPASVTYDMVSQTGLLWKYSTECTRTDHGCMDHGCIQGMGSCVQHGYMLQHMTDQLCQKTQQLQLSVHPSPELSPVVACEAAATSPPRAILTPCSSVLRRSGTIPLNGALRPIHAYTRLT